MRILLPTGRITVDIVNKAAEGYDADVVVTGEIASFLSPKRLEHLLMRDNYDIAVVSGMCTASFDEVEKRTGVKIYRGPRHAADLKLVLSLIDKIKFSATVPADEFLAKIKEDEAYKNILELETCAKPAFQIRNVKIGGNSKMKILAEIMDAHKHENIRKGVELFFAEGADIVDLGFGFDATPDDVKRVFYELNDLKGPLAVDSQEPELIRAALFRADLVLSLHDRNMDEIGADVASSGAAVVVVAEKKGLTQNIRAAQEFGIKRIIADPLLQPVGSGFVSSLCGFEDTGFPIFFGAGNVIELIDADSVGIAAILAGMAHEVGASVLFCSEHSDKTSGCVGEMKKAADMMALMHNRPYPKDLGIDLLYIKEKRKKREPDITYNRIKRVEKAPDNIQYDPCGDFRIGIKDGYIIAERNGEAVLGKHWEDVFHAILEQEHVSLLDHAAYLGKELYKAELAIRFGRSFEQDGPF